MVSSVSHNPTILYGSRQYTTLARVRKSSASISLNWRNARANYRTTQPRHFPKLSDGQFEDLVRQLGSTSGVDWSRAPEPAGRLASDRGRDNRGWDALTDGTWKNDLPPEPSS
jgi:hypothetical protein